ncbi:BAH domain, partial [Musa troglodytarum]
MTYQKRFGIDGSRRWRGRRQPTRERCKAMYGREGEEKKRQRHMRPALTPGSIATEAAAPLAFPYVNPLDSFSKGAHKSHVGECALFQSGNTLPFVEIIRWFTRGKEDCLKLCVNWLYRPTDIKLAKDILLDNFPNEVLYSFHKDAITAASLLHPCKVAFLEKGVELPSWISSFLCRRVYDIANKRLWWLTDQEYINKHQEEVDKLLNKTRLEMHAAVQSGSQKSQSTSASTLELKSGSDRVQNSDTSFPSQAKGKKRLGDQGEELVKGDQDMGAVKRDQGTELINQQHPAKLDDGDYVYFEFDNMKAEIAKITEKGGLISYEGVEKLVNLMQLGRTKKKVDLAGRIILADVIAATDKYDCLDKFVQLMGVSVLDDWLQEVHKGKPSDGRRHRDSDKVVEDFLLSLLQALDKLPVNLNALQTCNIGKSVNNLRTHKNLEIQKKARSLVDTWKKRVNAEISKTNDAKSVGSGRPVSCSVKPCSSDVSHSGNKRSGSTNVAAKMHSTQPSACRALSNKYGAPDSPKKENFPASIVVSLKDSHCKTVEEKSSGSSQSQNNSDQAKTMASSWKQEVRSSTAGSTTTSKLAGGSYHHRRSSNALLGTSIAACQRENHLGRSGSVNKVMTLEKASQRGQTSERPTDVPVDDHGNTNSLIVRLPTHGWSHRRSASGDSFEDPLVMSSRSSSPGIPDKQHHNNHKRQKNDVSQSHIATDANTVPLQHNDVKEDAGAEESCAKYSEASTPLAVRDDMGMNLPATVAAGEISKSDLISSTDSLGTSPVAEVPSNGNGESKLGSSCDDNMAKRNIQYDEAADANSEKEGKSIGSVLAMEPLQQQALSSDAVDESVNAVVLLAADNVPSPKAADESRNRKLGNSGINHLESGHEGNEPNCIPVSSIVEPVGSTVVSLVTAQIVGNLKEAHENCPLGSASQEPPSTLGTEETEHSAKSISSKISAFDSDGRKALASSAEPCSVIASAELDVATKLEFDLNEDLPADDENDGQPAVSAAASSSTTKGELGWKGSAATSAFRPAEPLKTLEMTPNDSDVSSFDGAGKLGQPPLGIDLNIADERVAKDMASQTWPLSVESGQFLASTSCRLEMPLLPGRPASEANMLRNFDLNDRPSPSEVGVEPVQRNQQARDVPFLAPVTDHRTSSGSGKMEGKGERLPSASKPLLAATSQAFMEEQTRMCGLSGVGSKRKEPEGSWDVDRSAKQYSR